MDRVFRMTLDMLLDDIMKKHIFGVAIAKVCVIEFQKRGLPHAHVLVFLEPGERPRTPEDCDTFAQAFLPDKNRDPILFECVRKHMLHGPCKVGLCINEETRQCRYDFRQKFRETTSDPTTGRVQWKCPNDGRTV
jgi:hypothetical protein